MNTRPLKVTLVGYGAIAQEVCALVRDDPAIHIERIIVAGAKAKTLALDGITVADRLNLTATPPDLLVECAGHSALGQHVLPALRAGVPCLVVSSGALAEGDLAEQLAAAAEAGNTQVHLLSGAVGAIDALAAARLGGLSSVLYEGSKPPRAWHDTLAQGRFDLDHLAARCLIFTGSAREAARAYPKNANVAATIALAGLGLDATEVRLYADPALAENRHRLHAAGAFGNFEMTIHGKPLAKNAKTSALTVFSVVRALQNHVHNLCI